MCTSLTSVDCLCVICFMCRDVNGHGTHVSGTAAGNYGVAAPYTPPGALLSGAAPRARLAVYKVG
jgi:subtilisin family serine protease